MKWLFIVFIFTCLSSEAQLTDIISSNTSVKTCVEEKQCSSVDDASYLFYDESKNEFYLKVDFTRFDSPEDSTDSWLEDLMDTHFYFKGYFEKDQFIPPSGTNSSSFKINGKAFLNGTWKDLVVDMTIFTMENTITTNPATDKSRYDQYKVNFSLSVLPKDFNLHKKPHHLNDVIYIDVALGRINLLRPGMEHLIKEAYDYH